MITSLILTIPIGVIGYWSAGFAAIVFTEHFIFRKNDFALYNIADWDQPRWLPMGIAATLSFGFAYAMIVPCMSQAWYIGPIAKAGTGDIGVLMAFLVTGILFGIFRLFEKRYSRKRLDAALEHTDFTE